jgi:hypothetical protein
MNASDIRSTLMKLCAAFNAHDLDGVMSFFTADRALECREVIGPGDRVMPGRRTSKSLSMSSRVKLQGPGHAGQPGLTLLASVKGGRRLP